jgi:phi13 family phage major tail protein
MAYMGLRKPIFAKLKVDGSYNPPVICGKAVGITVTPNYAEASLYGDDGQAEYDKEFTYADVTLNTTTLPIKVHEELFGHTVSDKNVKFNADDQNNDGATAWVSVEKVDGKRKFISNILWKTKYSDPSEDYSTKGESIEYKTPSISGRASALDNGDWKETEEHETAEAAYAWIFDKLGAKVGSLQVQSSAGTSAGTTAINVTPEKTGENVYMYKTGTSLTLPVYNDVCNVSTGWKSWNGTDDITAATGQEIVVAEVDPETYIVQKAGKTTVTAQTE